MKKYRWFWLGFGGVALLLMAVPVLNVFVLPAAVVALAKYDIEHDLTLQSEV
jgi:CysZ protein